MPTMVSITASVGHKGRNLSADVRKVQRLLNAHVRALAPLSPLKVDGACGPITIGMISEFQRRCVGMSRPDGRVDPNGRTLRTLNKHSAEASQRNTPRVDAPKQTENATELLEADYIAAANILSVDVATVKAVAAVESRGEGFLPNGKPTILFEGHWFSRFTEGRYDSSHPTLSYAQWTKRHYLGGIREYTRYNAAAALEEASAMKSTSWGKFQIMGFNHARCGYATVEQFVEDMHKGEGQHLNAFVKFIESTGLDVHLKARDWAAFANGYNGPRYAENQYDVKLARAYQEFSIEH